MDRTYLQWNIVNWITVALMAFAGMIVISGIASGWRAYNGQQSSDYSS